MSDSFWKKEISFGKKAKVEAEAEPRPAVELPKQSLLKKEISFSRKPKEPKAKAPKARASRRLPKEPKAAKESIWKKDLSLGKKQGPCEVERLVELAVQAVEPVPFPVEPVAVPQPTELAEAFVAAMPDPNLPAPEPVVLAVVPEPPSEAGLSSSELTPVELRPSSCRPIVNAVVDVPVEPMSGLSPEILAASAAGRARARR